MGGQIFSESGRIKNKRQSQVKSIVFQNKIKNQNDNEMNRREIERN